MSDFINDHQFEDYLNYEPTDSDWADYQNYLDDQIDDPYFDEDYYHDYPEYDSPPEYDYDSEWEWDWA